MKILLIENEPQTSLAIKEGLKSSSLVDIVPTGKEGLYQAEINHYDVIILDLGLPDGDGIELCKKVRAMGIKTPLMVLTARVGLSDKVLSLDSGADDYLSKPFSLAELQARLRALARRSESYHQGSLLTVGQLTLDTSTRLLLHTKNRVELRRKEYHLLEYLMRNPGKVIDREILYERIWGESDSNTNTVDVHIKLLRDKVDKPFGTHYIKTVHGMGYKLDTNS